MQATEPVRVQRESVHAQQPPQPASQPEQQSGGPAADPGKFAIAASPSADSDDLLDASFTCA